VTEELVNAGTRLRIVGRAGVGLDNVDVDACTARGILVINAPESFEPELKALRGVTARARQTGVVASFRTIAEILFISAAAGSVRRMS
jgi:lactate dehydrogenase-like 2-hydroxyacid dehydrogenase